MSERETAKPSGPDPEEAVSPEIAARMLGFTVPHVLELVHIQRFSSRIEGESIRIPVVEVEAFREQYQRQRAAIREINQIVNETPEGWDS